MTQSSGPQLNQNPAPVSESDWRAREEEKIRLLLDSKRRAAPPWGETFRFAVTGLAYAWRTQRNFRIELIMATLVLILAIVFGVSLSPILLCCALVLSLELVNTALEAVVDLASPTYHPLAKIAKDVAAGAVLFASVVAVLVGVVEFVPVLLKLFLAQ